MDASQCLLQFQLKRFYFQHPVVDNSTTQRNGSSIPRRRQTARRDKRILKSNSFHQCATTNKTSGTTCSSSCCINRSVRWRHLGWQCGLKGLFGLWQTAKENAKNIERMADFIDELSIDVHRLRAKTNEKFFMVSKELTAIRQAHDEFVEVQNENWKIVEQFDIFSTNINALRDCTNFFFETTVKF